ncbi:unnamed protein product [Wuchereria bancrofti]|uniref:Uncharacterized protein n=1 Tax=Wuchereria bancrofti TaxID=6293 RepID=A0A3P7DXA6_WUCBA|nr:unnamed protein product [Wuchereria bancrofti]
MNVAAFPSADTGVAQMHPGVVTRRGNYKRAYARLQDQLKELPVTSIRISTFTMAGFFPQAK